MVKCILARITLELVLNAIAERIHGAGELPGEDVVSLEGVRIADDSGVVPVLGNLWRA